LKLSRTLHESPATASLHSATPKRKNVSCFSDLRATDFSEKGKDIFLFGVLPYKFLGSVAGRNTDSVLPKLFSGGKDLAKPRLILFLHLSARRRGLGRNPRGLLFVFLTG